MHNETKKEVVDLRQQLVVIKNELSTYTKSAINKIKKKYKNLVNLEISKNEFEELKIKIEKNIIDNTEKIIYLILLKKHIETKLSLNKRIISISERIKSLQLNNMTTSNVEIKIKNALFEEKLKEELSRKNNTLNFDHLYILIKNKSYQEIEDYLKQFEYKYFSKNFTIKNLIEEFEILFQKIENFEKEKKEEIIMTYFFQEKKSYNKINNFIYNNVFYYANFIYEIEEIENKCVFKDLETEELEEKINFYKNLYNHVMIKKYEEKKFYYNDMDMPDFILKHMIFATEVENITQNHDLH